MNLAVYFDESCKTFSIYFTMMFLLCKLYEYILYCHIKLNISALAYALANFSKLLFLILIDKEKYYLDCHSPTH